MGAAAGALPRTGREIGREACGLEREAAHGGGADCARGAREQLNAVMRNVQ